MLERLARKLGVRRGQTTAEYAIIVALIAVCSIAVIMIFGDQIRALFAAEAHRISGDTGVSVDQRDTAADQAISGSLDHF
jgi:Flp pilus assembly pilin Flp